MRVYRIKFKNGDSAQFPATSKESVLRTCNKLGSEVDEIVHVTKAQLEKERQEADERRKNSPPIDWDSYFA